MECLFQLLGLLVDLDADNTGIATAETIDTMLDFFHTFLHSVTVPVEALAQAQTELATTAESYVRHSAMMGLTSALSKATSAVINVSTTVQNA
jgi:hypothetical protein